MNQENLKIQYAIMTEENKNEDGYYVPDIELLIQEAPCEEIVKAWEQLDKVIKKTKEDKFKFAGFTFRAVYTHLQKDGTYAIYQYPLPRDWSVEECEKELIKMIMEMEV